MKSGLNYKQLIFNNKVILISFFILILVATSVYLVVREPKPIVEDYSTKFLESKLININFQYLELADSEQERQQGLMFRKELCKTCGMLFVFENSENRSFWMENTYLPLDIIFIDDTGKIINITPDAVPLDSSKRYNSTRPAKYVLEVNSGFSKEFDLVAGDRFDILEMIDSSKEFVSTDN